MSKTLHADGGNGGHAYIYNGSASDVNNYVTPTAAQLSDLYFHSDLSYLANSQKITTTVSFPQRAMNSSSGKYGTTYTVTRGSQTHSIGTHSKGAAVPAIVIMDGVQITAGLPIQSAGGGLRSISVYVTATTVELLEEYITFNTTLGAISKTFEIYLFDYLSTGSGNTAISMAPSSFTAGFGKLNTSYKYTRKQTTNPDFYVTKDKTADVANGGLKIVNAGGTSVYTSSSYNGGFTGSTGTGIDV